MQFHFHTYQSHFHKNGFALFHTHFKTEAQGNSEMAYLSILFTTAVTVARHLIHYQTRVK